MPGPDNGNGTAWQGGAQAASPASIGSALLRGGGQIASEGNCMTVTPTEYPFGTGFPTDTIKDSD